MKILSASLLCLGLLGASGLSHAANNCTVSIKGDDAMRFDIRSATVSASCPSITVELAHTGTLPATSMGHNVVISATSNVDAVARDGIKAGAASNYVTRGDTRVIAATTLIGGGQKTKITFPGRKLTAGGAYTFFCSFPGHSTLMKGTLTVTR